VFGRLDELHAQSGYNKLAIELDGTCVRSGQRTYKVAVKQVCRISGLTDEWFIVSGSNSELRLSPFFIP
jgi:hypothetical protein